ncbi:MAG: hypothetical protein IKM61_09650 [Eubacteriaceae bacterium]|nr:hypothetical protein [Eubacteriaceae bacterium]
MERSVLLRDSIEEEKKSSIYSEADRIVLDELLEEINAFTGTDFHYLAELNAYNIKGSGPIMAKYVERFDSLTIKAVLLMQIVVDKVPKAAELTLKSYFEFKNSDEYIASPGSPAPAFIFVQYDNMFIKLRPKRLKKELFELVNNPRDAYYLPLTTQMLASWKIPGMKELAFRYFFSENVSAADCGFTTEDEYVDRQMGYIRRELKFHGINCLGYFAEQEVLDFLNEYVDDPDKDIQMCIKKNIKKIEKKLLK